MMGLATRSELDMMTVDEVNYMYFKANELYKMQHPTLIGEEG